MKIAIDGASRSGKSSMMGYLQCYMPNQRVDRLLVPEMAMLSLKRLKKDKTSQKEIFEMQKMYEEAYENSYYGKGKKMHLICDRSPLSGVPYIKMIDIPDEEKENNINEIIQYVKDNYKYVIYLEPIDGSIESNKKDFYSRLDLNTKRLYEKYFTKDVNLFFVPYFKVDVNDFDSEEEAIDEEKTLRGKYVLELIDKLIGCPQFGNFTDEYTVDSDCFICQIQEICKKATK